MGKHLTVTIGGRDADMLVTHKEKQLRTNCAKSYGWKGSTRI